VEARHYLLATMTPHRTRIAFLVFGLVWLTCGALTLTEADIGIGVVQLALGVAWMLVAAFKGRRTGVLGARRTGV
jgi:cell division protein FtsW (lipid II flippase)